MFEHNAHIEHNVQRRHSSMSNLSYWKVHHFSQYRNNIVTIQHGTLKMSIILIFLVKIPRFNLYVAFVGLKAIKHLWIKTHNFTQPNISQAERIKEEKGFDVCSPGNFYGFYWKIFPWSHQPLMVKSLHWIGLAISRSNSGDWEIAAAADF